jgi:predicted nuclease of predicted toxin-antitoxin system
MKFLVDAQLPVKLAQLLRHKGYNTIHTKELPEQNKTSDEEINRLSIEQHRVVITKDLDFVESFILVQRPYKLLLVTTGNIKNQDLVAIFDENIGNLVTYFEHHSYIEIDRNNIIIHS